MKNIFGLVLIILILLFGGCTSVSNFSNIEEVNYENIKDEIIRFHVLANSDSEEDQELKLRVRDAVIDYVYKELEKSTSLEESRQYLINNREKIEEISKAVIKENGYNYSISTSLGKENFPDKMYGDVLFPQGEYEAFRILIGESEGQNWWCVMFPPLCFVDETKETIDNYKTREKLNLENDKEEKIVFKFKIIESFKKLFS